MRRWIAALLAVVLLLCGSGCAEEEPPKPKEIEVTVMTQNVRLDGMTGEVDVLYRSEALIELIKKYKPDIIGVQEYTQLWEFMMEDYIEESDYEIEMQYRCDWAPEATAILYNAKRFELLKTEHFWLSDTPKEESLSYDDTLPRIVTRCDFREKESGTVFTHINTHLGLTFTAQENSGKQLNEYIKKNLKDQPVFLTGDMNCTVGSGGYNNITADGLLMDTYLYADEWGETTGTFNGFTGEPGTNVIDYIFATPKWINPTYYSVLLDQPKDIIISDHYAVLAKCIVKN